MEDAAVVLPKESNATPKHIIDTTVDLAKLSDEERWRLQHHELHEKHRGHESMHAEMVLILLGSLVIAQILLVQWKKRHFKSYLMASLIGMSTVPAIICIKYQWVRFILIWTGFFVITAWIAFKATRKPICMTTPRLVYKWFVLVYKCSYAVGLLGYVIIMMTLFGVNMLLLIKPQVSMDAGLLLLFYGLYFGVIGRDIAEVCSDKMASHIGYYTATGLPQRKLQPGVCAVCGNDVSEPEVNNERAERSYKLQCDHVFHEFCIRGWCIVGKKQTCPYCKEKVDLKRMFSNPWEKADLLYGSLLDWIRYLVVWQPVIVVLVQGINWSLGLE